MLSFGGSVFARAFATFADAPGMVAINLDGSLQSEVVRDIGQISAGDLAVGFG